MKPKHRNTLPLASISGLALVFTASALQAQTAWDGGGGNTNYSNNLNWAGDVIPGNGNNNGAAIGNSSTQTVIYNTATSYTSTGTGGTNRLIVGSGTSGNGSLTLSGSAGTLTFGGDGYNSAAWIGTSNNNTDVYGTVTVSAGKLAITSGTDASINLGVQVASGTSGVKSGTLTVNGGTLEVGRRILMGANSNSTVGLLTISSGTIDMKRTGSSGEGDLGMIRLGQGTNTVNLDGGTVIFSGFRVSEASSARSTIYMNGTTLRANASFGDLFSNGGTTNANFRLKTGGLIFDTNNFAVTINDNLTQETGHTAILRKEGLGTLTLSSTSDHSGATTITGGILSLTNANALQNSFIDTTNSIAGDATNGLRTNQTSLNLGGLSGNKNLAAIFDTTSGGYGSVTGISLHVATGNNLNYTGDITGTRTLSKSGAGTQTLSGTNTYTGTTTVTQGALVTTQASSLAGYNVAGQVIFNGGTHGVRIGGSGWTTGEVDTLLTNATKTSGALGIDTTNGNLTQWTAFTTTNLGSTLGLTKLGTNTLTLDQANTYNGATTVTAGKLLVNNTTGSGTGSGTVSIGTSGTLGGTGIISGAVNVTGQLSPGASIETLATGTLSLLDTSTLAHELDSSAAKSAGSDLLKVTGNLNLALIGTVNLTLADLAVADVAFAVNDTFSLINYTGIWNGGLFTFGGELLSDEEVFSFGLNTWKISYDDATGGLNYTGEYAGGADSFVNLTAVTIIPEPGAALLGGLGILLIFRRRR